MATSTALVDTLKRELRARHLTYAAVAKHLDLSEATVKRMFSKNEFTLARLDGICALAGLEFSDLARTLSREEAVISQLSFEQETEFVANPRLMMVALCALNHWRFEDILAEYDLSEAECIRLLARLEKLKFIELLPKNKIRLLVSRAFTWLPGGPIQRFFQSRVVADYFSAPFAGADELMLLANGAVSRASHAALIAKLKRTMAEFADMRSDDAGLPVAERPSVTLVLAVRPWEPEFLRPYQRAGKHGKSVRTVKQKR